MANKKSKALKNKLDTAIKDQKNVMEEVNSYIDFLKGKQYKKTPTATEATFNICHTTVQAILNSVLRGNSHIYIDPKSAEAVKVAPELEQVMNFLWESLDVKYQLELSVIDYAALGWGITYTDWEYQTDEDGKIVKDSPFTLNIPYANFLIDPRATTQTLMESDYMIREFTIPTKVLKADSRYKNVKNLKGDTTLTTGGDTDNKELSEANTLYRIWLLDEGVSYVMAKDSDEILRQVENRLGREYPFSIMQNYPMPGELRAFGEVKVLYEPQKILNKIFSLIMTHARRVSTRQYAANDRIDKTELRKLKDAVDGEVLSVGGNQSPTDAIGLIPDATLSSDVYRAYELINSAVVQLTSISQYRRSSMPQGQRKATEAAFVEQGTELSTSAKAEEVAKHSEDIAKKLYKYITDSRNINTQQITYKDERTGAWTTTKYNNESFPGEYKFRWESGVEGPLNKSTKQQKMLGVLQTIANMTRMNPQVAQSINWNLLLKTALKDFDIKNLDEIISPQPMPPQGAEGGGNPQGPNASAGQGETTPEVAAELSRSIGGYNG